MFRFVFFPAALLLLAGCTLTTNPQAGVTVGRGNISTADLQNLQRTFMGSYYASSGGFPTVARSVTPWGAASAASQNNTLARATISVNLLPSTSFATLVSNSAAKNTITNYPEPGASTSFTVTVADSTNHVYDIKATTTFPLGDTRASYVEEYFVKDVTAGNQPNNYFVGWSGITPNTTWGVEDPIVQPGNTLNPASSYPWIWNQNYRKQMRLTFTDGTTRDEYIVSGNNTATSGVGGVADPTFAAFDVNGSLDLSQQFVPATGSAAFSSVVVYETHPATNPNFWFWSGSSNQTIVGIRYYTEQNSGSTLTGTSVSFEKTVSTYTTTGGSYASALTTLNGGSTFNTLAQSVLREQISWPLSGGNPVLSQATVTKNMQTQVINLANLSQPTSFYVTQLNADYASISNFSTSAVYAPVGVIDGVVAANSSALLFTGNTVASGVSGALPLAMLTTSVSGGLLAQVYSGIATGTMTTSLTNGPNPSPNSGLMGTNNSFVFGGQSSVGQITSSTAVNLGATGWVEAWVYITQMTNTFGIVHYGQLTTFSDEGYSLQGWNANGQITMVVDTTGGAYDQVLSNKLLAPGVWYHIVGAWDVNASPKPYIALYINGVLDNTNNKLNNITSVLSGGIAGSQARVQAENSVLIGSQLPATYSAQYGYFGLNGKIVGVNIGSLDGTNGPQMVSGSYTASKSASLVAAQVAANYAASKNNTSGW